MKLATFKARVEAADTSGMFKSSFRNRRCIIFFEWTGDKRDKTPPDFSAADGELMAFAGLWDSWKDRETGKTVTSCTIIVREADAWSAKYHDRMPCMLHPRDFDGWLDGRAERDLLMQPPRELREWIVSKRVNVSGYV
ncbi:hypothetical protein OV14_b1038 (plasmid) [Ensifer adhaerens OV14]|nr:hypothetical protein OV14_b1038 [Ensifer adhaerens OV14]